MEISKSGDITLISAWTGMRNDQLVTDRDLRGLVDDWEEFLSEDNVEGAEAIRAATRTGRPAGSDKFIKLVERLTGRDLSKSLAGTPPKG